MSQAEIPKGIEALLQKLLNEEELKVLKKAVENKGVVRREK
jgi:hypothetical protein